MLSKSNTSVVDALRQFTRLGVPVGFLVPTQTALDKSIMDATAPVREFLRLQGIHDFDNQAQGRESKVELPARLLSHGTEDAVKVSLYRPETKSGDPRIWIQGLKGRVRAFDLLALAKGDDGLVVINMSDHANRVSLENQSGQAWNLVGRAGRDLSPEAGELIEMLREIGSRGFIPTIRAGDTGIGMTLEHALGIPPSATRVTDFKGIELKSGRRGRAQGRATLFSQVPDWDRSRLKSGLELIREHGYQRDGRRQLYCTVSNEPNSLGLFLTLDAGPGVLNNKAQRPDGSTSDVVTWQMETLCARMIEKHSETVWVVADSRQISGIEQFHYTTAAYTKRPLVENLGVLLETGKVTMDYTLSERESGTARDHGYLFRMLTRDLDLLFPAPIEYDLAGG